MSESLNVLLTLLAEYRGRTRREPPEAAALAELLRSHARYAGISASTAGRMQELPEIFPRDLVRAQRSAVSIATYVARALHSELDTDFVHDSMSRSSDEYRERDRESTRVAAREVAGQLAESLPQGSPESRSAATDIESAMVLAEMLVGTPEADIEDWEALDAAVLAGYVCLGRLPVDAEVDHEPREGSHEVLARRVEALERELRLRVEENDDLRQWIDILELQLRSAGTRNEELVRRVGNIRHIQRELVAYAEALEGQRALGQFDRERLEPVVHATARAARFMHDCATAAIGGALAVIGTVAIGYGGTAGQPLPTLAIQLNVVDACNAVIEQLRLELPSSD